MYPVQPRTAGGLTSLVVNTNRVRSRLDFGSSDVDGDDGMDEDDVDAIDEDEALGPYGAST